MSDQPTQHATPTVQVREVSLQEQASVGKVLAVAGVAGAVISTVIAKLAEKEEVPPARTESARAYLQAALENAQKQDLGKMTRKKTKAGAKKARRGKDKAEIKADVLLEQARMRANDSTATARSEFNSFLNTLKGGGMEFERLADEFAESTLLRKLREFGDEAREMAEQGKMKGADAAHKVESDLIPQARDAARNLREAGKERAAGVVDKAKSDLIPTAQHLADDLADKAKKDILPAAQHLKDDLADKAKNEFIPAAQKVTADVKDHTKDVVGSVGHDAEKLLNDATQVAAEKGKQAGTAVQRGGRETRSLLMWLGLAGILVFSVFLDEEQQKKLKEIGMEVFGEARDMYADMKGDQHNN
jgi:hypothetical protein